MNKVIPFRGKNEKSFNGKRLKAARVLRGMSATDLAEKCGVNRQTISMYENEKLQNPEYQTIQKFSAVLEFPVKFFLEELKAASEDNTVYFRSLLTTNKKYRIEQEEKIEFITATYNMLSEYLNFSSLNLPKIEIGTSPRDAAAALREHWKLGDNPIEDIVYLVEKNGMIVVDFESSTDDVDAFSKKIKADNCETYLIGYSKNKSSAARIHFDIAHELGHILMHSSKEDLESIEKEEFKEIEKQAHEFAGAFLLPENAFLEDIKAYATNISYYVELKKRWKTSVAAMIRRAKELNAISDDEYSRMMRKMQKLGIRKVEPLDNELMTAKPSLLKQAINLLLEKDVFTVGEFMSELSIEHGLTIYGRDLEKILSLPAGMLMERELGPISISLKE